MSTNAGELVWPITEEEMIEIKRRASLERAEAVAHIGRQIGTAVKRLFSHRTPATPNGVAGTTA